MIWWLLLAAAPAPVAKSCVPPAPEAKVKVKFKATTTVGELGKFASATLCEEWQVDGAFAARPLGVALEGEIPGQLVSAWISLLARSAGASSHPGKRVIDGQPEGPGGCPELKVVAVDPWTRELPKTSRDLVLNCAPAAVRVVPNFVAGKPHGFKLFGMRVGTVGPLLGFSNGDVVRAVNGLSLDGPEEALVALGKIKDAAELKIAIERGGQPRTITWRFK